VAGYSITIALVPGAELTVTGADTEELMEQYELMGGSGAWLVEKMKEMVPATENGEGVGALTAAINAALDSPAMVENDESALDGPETGQERVDPWSGEKVREPARRRSAARTEPSRTSSAHPASRPQRNTGDHGPVERTDRFGGRWVLGLPDAPLCDHQEPAALHTWEKRAGGKATAFKCAKGAPDGDWKNKCEFFEFPPR